MEQPWWNSHGGTVMVEQPWNSNSETVTVIVEQ